jgi:hypothetical protein
MVATTVSFGPPPGLGPLALVDGLGVPPPQAATPKVTAAVHATANTRAMRLRPPVTRRRQMLIMKTVTIVVDDNT